MASKQVLLSTPVSESKQSRRLYMQWRVAELIASIFSSFGLVSATADYEYGFSSTRSHNNCAEEPEFIYKWLTLTFTLISAYFLILRHYLKSKWHNKRSQPLPGKDSKKSAKKKNKRTFNRNLLLEVLLLSILPYPYLKGGFSLNQPKNLSSCGDCNETIELCYTYSEIIYVCMFVRLWFLLRALFNFTPYQDDHARYYCSRTGTKANVRFSIRCMMKTHPFLLIYCFSFPSFFLLGVFLRVFERPFSDVSGQNFASYQNAVWNCAITMSTIGYGDLYPSTVFGRMVAVMCAIMGGFIFSMIVFTFQSLLELGTRQNEAFITIKQTRAAARVISECLCYNLIKRNFGSESSKAKTQMKKIQNRLENFNLTMKKLKKLSGDDEEENPIQAIHILSSQIQLLESKVNKLI